MEKLDNEYKEKRGKLISRLKDEQFYTKWIYEVPNAKYETLIIPKNELVKAKKKSAEKKKPAKAKSLLKNRN